jgi:NAD(P)-dependent dehydrogenase (short-subunit alcohol dehydrogenase family)
LGRLDGKVAIVTGAGSGIGRATAILFAKEGAKVIVNDRRTDGKGEETVKMIKNAGGEATYVHADVSKEAEVKKLVKTAVDTYGKLNIMIANAGVQRYKPIAELTEDDFDFIIATNQKGVFFCIKNSIPAMVKAGGGAIVATASVAADHAQHGSCIYAGTKGAVLSMMRVFAAELAEQNIRVNAVQPGVIRTGMSSDVLSHRPDVVERIKRETPQHRIGEPEEVAPLFLFLASDEASHITGQKMAVDGGILAESHII